MNENKKKKNSMTALFSGISVQNFVVQRFLSPQKVVVADVIVVVAVTHKW